jgi:hypothetical protein
MPLRPPADPPAPEPARPRLDLSGPALASSLETLVAGSEEAGGIETYIEGIKAKTGAFQRMLGDGKAAELDEDTFKALCAFVAPVRRRVGPRLEANGFPAIREAVAALLDGASDTATADARLDGFCGRFPRDKQHRWVRDLAAELLHYTDPERYPLMCRWVWDARANTGVLREIWHGDNVDHMVIDVPDGYQTFLVLREELSQFLTDNGVFRDVIFYVDLLCAQVYAGYISAQGGSYLRADFSSPGDPLAYTRRLLGLDGINARTGRSRFKAADGGRPVLDDVRLLN